MLVSELKRTCSLAERQAVPGPRSDPEFSRHAIGLITRCNVRQAALESSELSCQEKSSLSSQAVDGRWVYNLQSRTARRQRNAGP